MKIYILRVVVTLSLVGVRYSDAVVTTDGCGKTKNCFRNPDGCELTDPGCRFISWAPASEQGKYLFEMSGSGGAGAEYVAVALGSKNQMSDADLYYCDGKAVQSGMIQIRYSPPAYNEMTNGLEQTSAATVNGVAQCSFLRPASVTKTVSNNVKYDFDITKDEYYLLMAVGPMATNSGDIQKHDWRFVTGTTFNFADAPEVELRTQEYASISGEISTDGCGDTKTCFKDPTNCDITDKQCRFFSWRKGNDGKYIFEMSGGIGSGEQYIALALGKESLMQDADLYYCDGKRLRSGVIQELHYPPAYLSLPNGMEVLSASTVNGVAQCSFARPTSVTKEISGGVTYDFDLSKSSYYLLGAVGPMNGSQILKHDTWRTKTSDPINFSKLTDVSGISRDQCGVTKSCQSFPDANCAVGTQGCYFYSWKKEDDGTFTFEIVGGAGSGKEYAAIALGTQSLMIDADLYFCDGVTVRSGVIRDRGVEPDYVAADGLLTKSAKTINGVAQCVFNRPASVVRDISGGVMKNFDLNAESYFLLAASGKMNGEKIDPHTWKTKTESKVISSEVIPPVRRLGKFFAAIEAELSNEKWPML